MPISVALPILVVFAILVAWFGGGLVSVFNDKIGVSFQAFFTNLRTVVDVGDVLNGLFKSFVFAVVIGSVSCHHGLTTIGGPRGIDQPIVPPLHDQFRKQHEVRSCHQSEAMVHQFACKLYAR